MIITTPFWNDFVSIRINWLMNQLKSLFIDLGRKYYNTSNDSNNSGNTMTQGMEYFYSFLKYRRNQCLLLPTNCSDHQSVQRDI